MAYQWPSRPQAILVHPPRIALLCAGLGHIRRGHEVFARDLFDLLKDDLDITLFKGGGQPAERELVVPNIPRNSPALAGVHALASPKWIAAAQEQERLRAEGESFAWGAMPALLAGGYDIVHTLEREVCSTLWANRHLFEDPTGRASAAFAPPQNAASTPFGTTRMRSGAIRARTRRSSATARRHPGLPPLIRTAARLA